MYVDDRGAHQSPDLIGTSGIDTSDPQNSFYTDGYTDTSKMFRDICKDNTDVFTYEVSKGLKKLGKIDANVKKLT